MNDKKRILTGIQPTGNLTIGNYLGAIKSFASMQDDYDCFFFIADLHSVTTSIVPAQLRSNTLSAFALLIAAGIDPSKTTLFVQSHVPAHAELAWIFNCLTYYGEAKRMTQFKDKSKKNPDNINVGLFAYPVLQAADILLYNPDLVPIGADQKQHIELTKVVAERFNNRYSPTFTLPEAYTPKVSAKIMSLQEPTAKMSKSDPNENSYILMMDSPEVIARKIKRAVTDSEATIAFDPKARAGVSNLLSIIAAFSGESLDSIVAGLEGQSYGALKAAATDAVIAGLSPIQAEYNRLIKDKAHLEQLVRQGAEKASRAAAGMLAKVYRKVGLLERVR